MSSFRLTHSWINSAGSIRYASNPEIIKMAPIKGKVLPRKKCFKNFQYPKKHTFVLLQRISLRNFISRKLTAQPRFVEIICCTFPHIRPRLALQFVIRPEWIKFNHLCLVHGFILTLSSDGETQTVEEKKRDADFQVNVIRKGHEAMTHGKMSFKLSINSKLSFFIQERFINFKRVMVHIIRCAIHFIYELIHSLTGCRWETSLLNGIQ